MISHTLKLDKAPFCSLYKPQQHLPGLVRQLNTGGLLFSAPPHISGEAHAV